MKHRESSPHPEPQITVLDAGGQYCHLIARKVRDLGVYSEVKPSDTPASELRNRKGIIISGGPASVFEPDSPSIDRAILAEGTAVLGICYGLHLIAHELGGRVRKGEKGEYGLAHLETLKPHRLLDQLGDDRQIWMSHRDAVETVPEGFEVLAASETCGIAAMAHRELPLLGVQFHPEVIHTRSGNRILQNFVFDICHCERDWNPKDRIASIEEEIRRVAGDRNIFFFVSGGVDSTVAYTLCLRALGAGRVYGIYVDTGLMREGETEYVRDLFRQLGATAFQVESAEAEFLRDLEGVFDPEAKRRAIGEGFVAVQDRILNTGHFLDGQWILGQGTIYPDTIESGGSAKADVIKTHHNRVAGIQKLVESGRIVEPLASFYKDEVREIGRELGIPAEFLERHPFPGPGLGIRCLCSDREGAVRRLPEGWLAPIRSVGVQGDSRSYRDVLVLDDLPSDDRATEMVNRIGDVNRVVARVASRVPLSDLRVEKAEITPERLARLRRADAIVRRISKETGFDRSVWQFPVVLIPLGSKAAPDSVVLRPIDSVDGMTAQVVLMPEELLRRLANDLLAVEGIAAVFYDLTHKPPGTIEWE
ncbi:MAG TPA: glutamine-hydrolyzing GMP synthase [Bryobacteraceae bacterium]|nr:glutamine-hydrolyzing GMP synthase [Bryobacteraceae bacterium]